MRSSAKNTKNTKSTNTKAAVKAEKKAEPKPRSRAASQAASKADSTKAASKAATNAATPSLIVSEEGGAVQAVVPTASKVAKAGPAAKAPKEKVKKPKLVRDSFAMPEAEYEVLRDLKKSCMKAGIDIKKSELLRVGVAMLKKQTPEAIQAALSDLVTLKAGRPRKEAESTEQTATS